MSPLHSSYASLGKRKNKIMVVQVRNRYGLPVQSTSIWDKIMFGGGTRRGRKKGRRQKQFGRGVQSTRKIWDKIRLHAPKPIIR